IVGLILALVLWLALARIDIIVTADGKLATTESLSVVQPFETSIVRSISVKVGQKVSQGDVLATLDPTFAEADEADLSAKLRGIRALYDRLAAELDDAVYEPAAPDTEQATQVDIWRKRRDEYAAHVNAMGRKIQQFAA